MTLVRLFLLLSVIAASGCKLTPRRQEAKIVDPVLPTTISRDELVEYLNSKTEGLESWRCTRTQVHVKSPELPISQKLTGTLACSAPGNFRLVCDNMVGRADFGANQDICWVYVKPGESTVMTWKHEDSHLLQHIPGGMPRLEPEWLMTILGIQPLDPEHYELQNAPLGSREVWLAAVEDAADGTSLRRVIKVDTVTGVARLHALYDSELRPLLMVHLSDHQKCGSHSLPHTVRIEFPATETQLTLNFTNIETDCQIADKIWYPPSERGVEVVDLGAVIRSQLEREPGLRPRGNHQPIHGRIRKTASASKPESNEGRVNAIPVSNPQQESPLEFDEILNDKRFYSEDIDVEDLATDEEGSAGVGSGLSSDFVAPPEFDSIKPAAPARKRFSWFGAR